MPTQSLNDPIDGAELKQIILHRIAAALDKDCTLVDDIAYAGFCMTFNVKIAYKRSKTADTTIWGGMNGGPEPIQPGQNINLEKGDEMADLTDTYESDSPNTAREEHDLPIPIMVKTPSGSERRKIHINPPKAKVTT